MNLLTLLRRALWFVAGPVVVAGLGACQATNDTILFQTQCAGKTLLLQKVVRKTFATEYVSAHIVYAGKAPVVLSISEMGRSRSYDAEVYGKAPFHLFDFKPHTYNSLGTTLTKLQTVLYINPKLFSLTEFEALANCLKTHSDDFSSAIEGAEKLQQFQIVGAVYGKHQDFVERFTKNTKDFYEVAPDGSTSRTQFDAGGIKGMKSESLGGLSKVMPGRILEITDPQEASMAMLKTYKNTDGKALTERFRVVTKANIPNQD